MKEEKISIKESIYLTFKNKIFLRWLLVNCCTYFGLQMFLVSMNSLIIGGMGMSSGAMAILNTCAFAPVPIMLYLFNKLKAKKGIRFTYQTCLVAFAVAILSFFFASTFMVGTENKMLQYILGCVGGVVGSWAIGAFFMMPYHITAQISSVEEKLTHKNHSAMYFAANAVCTSIVSAISGSLVYELVKNLFISKETGSIVWATSEEVGGTVIDAVDVAAKELGSDPSQVFNFGLMLVPFIVATFCIIGVILAFRMPRDYTPELVAKELKELDPTIDLDAVSKDESFHAKEEKGEIMFVQIGLYVLSGALFGFIWPAFMFKAVRELATKFMNKTMWALSCFIPFVSAFAMASAHAKLQAVANEKGVKLIGNKVLFIILGILIPILPLNIIALIIMQKNLNRIYKAENTVEA